jgi:hypothetical protein
MSRCEVIVLNKEGKLLTNQTTDVVDITITTTFVRAAEQLSSRGVIEMSMHLLKLQFRVEDLICCHLEVEIHMAILATNTHLPRSFTSGYRRVLQYIVDSKHLETIPI